MRAQAPPPPTTRCARAFAPLRWHTPHVLLLVATAHALTLDQAVHRAAEVNPDAAISALEWRQAQLDAAHAWASQGLTPSASASRTFAAGSTVDSTAVGLDVGVLNVPGWFDALQHSADARAARSVSDATSLDAQYAVAGLFYSAVSAQAGLDAARAGEGFAKATADATAARVAAGLESELAERSARLGVLEAQAETARAEAAEAIAMASLERALEQDVDGLEPAAVPELPAEAGRSPWLDAANASVDAAKWQVGQRWTELLPVGQLSANSSFAALNTWSITLGVSWSWDGVAGPFLDARSAVLSKQIAEIERDALERDLDLQLRIAREQARAAERVAEAARARQQLAEESLQVGQARLAVGLATSLQVLRLQDDAASARADKVAAELDEVLARLEARRVAGLGW